jgi:hypothetical protein
MAAMETEKAIENIPEVYFDIIARLVPGAVVIGLYLMHDHKSIDGLGEAFFGLVFSYALGLFLETISGLVIENYVWQPLLKKLNQNGKLLQICKTHLFWKTIRANSEVPNTIKKKVLAERYLFRSLLFAAFLMLIVPPKILCGNRWAIVLAIPVLAYGFYAKTKTLSKWTIEQTENDVKKTILNQGGF